MGSRSVGGLRTCAVLAFALALPFAGCGDDEGTPTETQPSAGPLVEYSRSGGVAGINEQLTVEPDGAATLETISAETSSARFRLGEAELGELEQALAAADLGALADPPPQTGCADCFEYTIVTGDQRAAFDQLADTTPEIDALLVMLDELVSAHLPDTLAG